MFVGVSPLALAVSRNLVYPDLLVPTRHGEEVAALVLGGREGEVRDAVLGRVAEGDVRLEVADSVARRRGRRAAKEAGHDGGGIASIGLFGDGDAFFLSDKKWIENMRSVCSG